MKTRHIYLHLVWLILTFQPSHARPDSLRRKIHISTIKSSVFQYLVGTVRIEPEISLGRYHSILVSSHTVNNLDRIENGPNSNQFRALEMDFGYRMYLPIFEDARFFISPMWDLRIGRIGYHHPDILTPSWDEEAEIYILKPMPQWREEWGYAERLGGIAGLEMLVFYRLSVEFYFGLGNQTNLPIKDRLMSQEFFSDNMLDPLCTQDL